VITAYTANGHSPYTESVTRTRPSTSTRSEPSLRAVAYLRVSTTEQADSGAGLAAQRAAIDAEVDRRGWTLVAVQTDTASGKSIAGRDALDAALAMVESGGADVLVVAKLDRLSRSLLDFAALMARARSKGWILVALDLGIDLSTPAGEFLASVMASAAQWERRIIGQRTKEALAARKAAGVRLGRPRTLATDVVEQMARLRTQGWTFQRIADQLNGDGVPTAQGGRRWYASTVSQALAREAAAPAPAAPLPRP